MCAVEQTGEHNKTQFWATDQLVPTPAELLFELKSHVHVNVKEYQ